MKRGFALFVITLFLISLVSAYYGSYSSFSLGDLLEDIDASTMILGALFVIFFGLINFALVRALRGNKATAGIISFAISLLMVWGINRSGFDFEGLIYGVGLSGEFLSVFLPILIIIGIIILGVKFGFGITLMAFGLLIIAYSFTSLVYSKGAGILTGLIIFAFGCFLWIKRKKETGTTP